MANTQVAGKILEIKVGDIDADPNQPRSAFDQEALKGLAASIKARGVLQALVVRKSGKDFIIKMGERRWRAAKLAGVKTVPCIVVDDEQDAIERGLDQVAENELRSNLNPMEMAEFLVRLREQEHKSVDELADALEKAGMKHVSRPLVSNLMRLVELPDWAKDMIRAGTIGAAHGKYILQAKGLPEVLKRMKGHLAQELNWKGTLTVRDIESSVRTCMRQAGVDLTSDWGEDARKFDIKVCQGCEFFRELGKHDKYCFNKAEFLRKNKEAKALIQEKEERKAKTDKVSAKEEARMEAENKKMQAKGVQTRIEQFVEDWLRKYVVETALPGDTTATAPKLVAYLAAMMPDGKAWYGDDGVNLTLDTNHYRNEIHHALVKKLKRLKLKDWLATHVSMNEQLQIAQACVEHMDREQLHELARHLGVQLDPAFRISEDYLALLRRPQLEQLAKAAKLPTIAGMTGKQIKAELLKPGGVELIGVPAAVARAYKAPEVSQETREAA